MKVTMQQIAERAGVSRGTVDKVLHNRGGVGEEVRERVQRILEESGYQYKPRNQKNKPAGGIKEIAAIIPMLTDPYHKSAYNGIQRACALLGKGNVHVSTYFMQTHYPDGLAPILRELLQNPPDGMILQGVLNDEIDELLARFVEKNIPFVLYDSDNPATDRLCFVGENAEKSGRIGASLMAKRISKKGSVLLFGGVRMFLSHGQRVDGFKQLIESQYPGIHVVDAIETMDTGVIYDKTRRAIQQYDDLSGIFIATGHTTAVARAVIDEGRSGSIGVVGYHNSGDVKAMVDIGMVDFALDVGPFQQGYQAFQALHEYLCYGQQPEEKVIHVPIQIVIDELLDILVSEEF